MFPRRFLLPFLTFLGVALLGTGCVTSGRRVLLKEYGPSIPVVESNSLKGATVYLKHFESAPDLVDFQLQTKPEEPPGFKYMNFSREQNQKWTQEVRAMGKPKRGIQKIGNMRNGFGMVLSHVYALNEPISWLEEGLRYDLEAHGAKVVDASQASAADVTVGGILQLCRVDMYMTVNASLVVGLAVQAKDRPVRQRQIHTHGATAAMLASKGEYFHALRDARQKFSILAIREISQALGRTD